MRWAVYDAITMKPIEFYDTYTEALEANNGYITQGSRFINYAN